MDPLAGSAWSEPGMVAGFARSSPNTVLMGYAEAELRRLGSGRVVDIGCGAGRNAVPLAQQGWDVLGVDLSWPMLRAAAARARDAGIDRRLQLALAPMHALPVPERSADLVVAQGIWNLARSGAEFRLAVHEAARVARPGAALFVFTFSRNTFPPHAQPVPGESFVFDKFSGEPQCFVTAEQLLTEMHGAGFEPDPGISLTEYNRPRGGMMPSGTVPVIYEAAFRRLGSGRR
jgi:SAM-dependent methyltransferase